ncbi:CPBP family intramembrane glutamic endopeptidase [Microscilla marina]|uniref:Caax amino terminal protease family n=1 Tax=Microscilla marina ATCC 23134 TaxID=313606 RepID=A1ZNB2_MICM2|nr:CPBP family intramembrane glutamic endopeptidase [Microscilla marina]EAY28023.1 caax amino terminal protease family [Microscilla marina ATCC 23134]
MKKLFLYLKQFWQEAGNLPYLLMMGSWLAFVMWAFHLPFGHMSRQQGLIFQATAYFITIVLAAWGQRFFYAQAIQQRYLFWRWITLALAMLLIRKGFVYHRVWIKTQVPFSLQYIAEQLTVYSFRVLTFALPVCLIWYFFDRKNEPRLYGFSTKNFSPLPYLLLLLSFAPFIYWASTTPGFLLQYPMYKSNFAAAYLKINAWIPMLSFEALYGIDFVFVEVFFRGFLIILIGRYLGPRAIILAASLYCLFHLGKPVAETASSFFGGMLLGIFSYYSRSIYGGIILHLGVAYMMELFAFWQEG